MIKIRNIKLIVKLPCIDNEIRIRRRALSPLYHKGIVYNFVHCSRANIQNIFYQQNQAYMCMSRQYLHTYQSYQRGCIRTEYMVLSHLAILHMVDNSYWCISRNWFQSLNPIQIKTKYIVNWSRKLYASLLLYRAVETNTASTINAICVNTHATLIDLWIIIAFVGMSIAL